MSAAYDSGASKPNTNYHSVDDGSGEREPLLTGSSQNCGGVSNQPSQGNLPEDFKHGVSVSQCSPEIRAAFVRKVYTILLFQIAATTLVGGIVSHSPSTISWVKSHMWAFYVPLLVAFINFLLVLWKSKSYPWNFVLLSTFTLLEAFTLGFAISYVRDIIVLQALLVTFAIFLSLTMFTFQSKYNFEGMGPFLVSSLTALCMTGLLAIFIPFSRGMDIVYAIGGCFVFSGYIVFDTYMINKRLATDEFIYASLTLYIDLINLFYDLLNLLLSLTNQGEH